MARTKKPKTITRLELATLAFVNSKDLPPAVVDMKPRRLEWVGIGWIDVGEPRGDEVVVVDGEAGRSLRKARKA